MKLTVSPVAMVTSSRSPSENGSVISNESGKPSSGRRSPQNVMAQQKVTKEEARKRNGEKPSRQEPPPATPTRACTHMHAHVCAHSHSHWALTLSRSFYSAPQGPEVYMYPLDFHLTPSLNYPVSLPLPLFL